ncbi:alpha/beta hydrolase [Thermodesulfobacteriota bacterium]
MEIKWPHLIGLIVLLGVLFILFYSRFENFFIFFPDTSLDLHPKDFQLEHEDVFFDTEDGRKLHGWFFPLDGEKPIILFFHGNAGNISHRLDNITHLVKRGLQVFIFDYRGYGKSSGRPSEKGLYLDGIAAYDYLVRKRHFTPDRIVLFGRSLGGAVAVEVALQRSVRAIIAESAFTSTRGMAKTMWLFRPIAGLLPAHYNNHEKIKNIEAPKLIIHGINDELVPFHMGQALHDAAPTPKFFFPIKGAGHNDTYIVGGTKYFQNLTSFVLNGNLRTR